MTAHDLIADIFARQAGAGAMCRITRKQLDFLRSLIGQDEEGGSVTPGTLGSVILSPSGRWNYVLTEDRAGEKHTLMRLARISALAPSLF